MSVRPMRCGPDGLPETYPTGGCVPYVLHVDSVRRLETRLGAEVVRSEALEEAATDATRGRNEEQAHSGYLSDQLSDAEDALPDGFQVDDEHDLALCIQRLADALGEERQRSKNAVATSNRHAEELLSIRRDLGGLPDSKIEGANGLAKATYAALGIERDRADRAESRVAGLRERLFTCSEERVEEWKRAEKAEAEVTRLRHLCGEVWGWDRSLEREGGMIPGPLNVALRMMLLEASDGALSSAPEGGEEGERDA